MLGAQRCVMLLLLLLLQVCLPEDARGGCALNVDHVSVYFDM